MTITQHPSDGLLLDYASGALGEAWSLAIATHAALCPTCRETIALMEQVGGTLLDSAPPAAVAEAAFADVMALLDAPANDTSSAPSAPPEPVAGHILPNPLRRYLGSDVDGLRWQRLGVGAYHIPIATGDKTGVARLLRIPAGRKVPEHSHGGLELTLVLCGAFSDSTGMFRRGDLEEADDSLRHQPHAAPGEDCICLAVTDAQLRFSSRIVRAVQPLLKI